MFLYELAKNGQNVDVYFKGDLDIEATEAMEAMFQEIRCFHTVSFDLSAVPFVDSTGIGLLVHFIDALKEDGKQVMIFGIQPEVNEVFRIVQLEEILGVPMFCQSRGDQLE
ncbi:STAS domain-containing protein [Geobacillus sp. G4]|uniref:Anti-sigmaB factor antagonist n=3 Tax=Geobacillus TaxID=129337 RepID=Q5KZX2_GEOKA|nr:MULTISPECIES: STAS domain-containing protein [Geobacillus]AMV10719.1 anti-anti-sigma factor [Geobacillus thermoleovorans]AUI35584.1 anti-sigma factor antagonist [[Bacillus] caldolyticus]ESU71740.1 anti-sigma factor antagonist [Geobacillus sp. MAS1]TLS33396.1 STAS domain-containing protein [Geobacillus thermoleovorans]TRY43568.1 STAS domain-containing protein [Geobacillus sp. LEMMJ02]